MACRLQLRTARPQAGQAARRQVRPVAFIDKAVSGIARIFSPDSVIVPQAPKDAWSVSGAGFCGKLPHTRNARKPFKDGFANTSAKAKAKAAEPAEASAVDYLQDAAKHLVAHNFPHKGDAATPTTGTSGFTGDIPRRERRPFRDDYANTSAKAKAKAAEPAEANAMDYLKDATKSVAAHNFPHKGDNSTPSTGSTGFTGDIHYRKKDGFHSSH